MVDPFKQANIFPAFPKTEQQFLSVFSDEEACLNFLFHARWPDGFQCPYCRWQHQPAPPTRTVICFHCGHPSSITTNTIMHGSKKALSTWLLAIWWLCASETETSAKNLQRLLNLASYQTAWAWLQKLRTAMGIADNIPCHGLVELGCASVLPAWEKPHHAFVIAATEIILPAEITGRIRMATLDALTPAAIHKFLRKAVLPGSTIFTPNLLPYQELDQEGYLFVCESPGSIEGQKLRIENPHRSEQLIKSFEIWLNKVHRGGVALKHLHLYLDEFCFRNNSAMLPNPEAIFNLLLHGVLAHKPKPYRELVSTQDRRTP